MSVLCGMRGQFFALLSLAFLFLGIALTMLVHSRDFSNQPPALALAILFGVLGSILLTSWFNIFRKHLFALKAQALAPSAPWAWRADWANRYVTASPSFIAKIGVLLALFGNFFVIFIGSLILDDRAVAPAARDKIAFRYGIVSVLAMIGTYLLIRAFLHWKLTAAFDKAVLRLPSIPLQPGRSYSFELALDPSMRFDQPAPRVQLNCLQHSVSAKSSRLLNSTELTCEQIGPGMARIHATIPNDLPSSSAPGQRPHETITWLLRISGTISSKEVIVGFELPIFQA